MFRCWEEKVGRRSNQEAIRLDSLAKCMHSTYQTTRNSAGMRGVACLVGHTNYNEVAITQLHHLVAPFGRLGEDSNTIETHDIDLNRVGLKIICIGLLPSVQQP